MTPQTAKDLAELGMTPEQMQERQSKLGAILHGSATSFDPATVEAMPTPPARTRQPRSDKGTTRPPKAMPAASGATESAITAVEALMHERAMLFLRISEIDKELAAVRKVVASFDSVSQSSK